MAKCKIVRGDQVYLLFRPDIADNSLEYTVIECKVKHVHRIGLPPENPAFDLISIDNGASYRRSAIFVKTKVQLVDLMIKVESIKPTLFKSIHKFLNHSK